MIDKSKPFYIVRTPEFGTGEAYNRRAHDGREYPVPPLWRAKQTKDEAVQMALEAGAHGKQFDVYELVLVGSTKPPVAQWVPAKVRRAKRKAKRK